ncbi:NRDE family protein, partial [Myxococcota bacterium]|nr:NRDE family protein [Myxococcota bacterium]
THDPAAATTDDGLEPVTAGADRVPRPGFDGVCVHVPPLGYGTRSSTIVRFDARGTATFLHADGPPCQTAHTPVPVPWRTA